MEVPYFLSFIPYLDGSFAMLRCTPSSPVLLSPIAHSVAAGTRGNQLRLPAQVSEGLSSR